MGQHGTRREPTGTGRRDHPLAIRFSDREIAQVEQQRADRGFKSISDYIRWLIRSDMVAATAARDYKRKPWLTGE